MNINLTHKEIKNLLNDYQYNDDIMDNDDPKVRLCKKALTLIPESDRIIFLLQTDIQSQRKVGELLGVSHSIVGRCFNEIKKKLLDIINSGQVDD